MMVQKSRYYLFLAVLLGSIFEISCHKTNREQLDYSVEVRVDSMFKYYNADTLVCSCANKTPDSRDYVDSIYMAFREFRERNYPKDFFRDCPNMDGCLNVYWIDYLQLTKGDSIFNSYTDIECLNTFLRQLNADITTFRKDELAAMLSKTLLRRPQFLLTKERLDSLTGVYEKRFMYLQVEANQENNCNWNDCLFMRNISTLNEIRANIDNSHTFYVYNRVFGYVGPIEKSLYQEPFYECRLYEDEGILQLKVRLLNPWAEV